MTPASTWNTRLSPPPLTVTPAAGPVIVSVPRRVAQLELGAGQGDRLRRGEHRGVEGDVSRLPTDRCWRRRSPRAGSAGPRPGRGNRSSCSRPGREDRAGVRQIERGRDTALRRTRRRCNCRASLLAAAVDGGLAAGDDGRRGRRRIAAAPLAAGRRRSVTTPPSTGSTGLLAVTVTASGLANAVPMSAVCGVLPATGVKREALALEGADVDGAADAGPRRAGRWCARMPARWCPRRWPGCRAAGPWSGSGRRSRPGARAAGRRRPALVPARSEPAERRCCRRSLPIRLLPGGDRETPATSGRTSDGAVLPATMRVGQRSVVPPLRT